MNMVTGIMINTVMKTKNVLGDLRTENLPLRRLKGQFDIFGKFSFVPSWQEINETAGATAPICVLSI